MHPLWRRPANCNEARAVRGESSLALEMESGITAMETSLLGLREQRAEAEGTYQQMQGLLR